MSTLSTLRSRLTLIENKIAEILETGEEYSISGAFTVRNPKLLELEKQEQIVKGKIAKVKGYHGRTLPNFSGNGSAGSDYYLT